MTGVTKSPTQQSVRSFSSDTLLLILSTGLMGLLLAGCGGGSKGKITGGVGGTFTEECSNICDPTCTVYSPTACGSTGTDTSGSGDTSIGDTSGNGGCSDSADPSCTGYDPVGSDGGGGDGACDSDSCDGGNTGDTGGNTGDVGDGGGDTGGDGGGGDGGDGGGGGDPGDGGGDPNGGIVHPGGSAHLVIFVAPQLGPSNDFFTQGVTKFARSDARVKVKTAAVLSLADTLPGFSKSDLARHSAQSWLSERGKL